MKKSALLARFAAPAALVVMSVGGLTALASTAVFGSAETPTSNGFTSGTVDIATAPASSVITMSNMAPGDTKYGTMTVTNSGSLEHRYSMRTVVADPAGAVLANAMMVTVKAGVTDCSAAGFTAGTAVYGAGALASTAIGNPSQGQQTGDRILAAKATETLCFKAELPVAVKNEVQGTGTTATFNFTAEQTRNNG